MYITIMARGTNCAQTKPSREMFSYTWILLCHRRPYKPKQDEAKGSFWNKIPSCFASELLIGRDSVSEKNLMSPPIIGIAEGDLTACDRWTVSDSEITHPVQEEENCATPPFNLGRCILGPDPIVDVAIGEEVDRSKPIVRTSTDRLEIATTFEVR
ncbi:uncharacterized protein LOC134225602 [Armigeres subalbatus]|uniref:uncharacterized protein LOC134225602 n=1 Tax=Armigeres subalbatus TaxID=124917 RepID=UPI002ED00917